MCSVDGHHPFLFTSTGMNRLYFCLMAFLFAVCTTVRGVNVIREVRKTVKNARYMENADEAKKVAERLNGAEKSLMDALAQEKNPRKHAGFYYMAALVQCRFNDIENEKIFLKRAYDTTLYYNTIYKIYAYLEQCDSAETSVSSGGRMKYRPSARRILLEHRANLLNACRFYLRKKDYAEACRFMSLYLHSADYPMLKRDFLGQTDTMYARVAYWLTSAAYHVGAYHEAIRYAPVAYRYPHNREFVQEYLCKSYLAVGDTLGGVQALKNGIVNFPDHTYFFSNLMIYLNKNGKYDEALQFADRMIDYDPKNSLFWLAKAMTCMRMEDYPHCIENCDVVLIQDSMDIKANYLKGLACCNMARSAAEAMEKEDLHSARYKSYKMDMMEYYAQAALPLERVRRQTPDQAGRWAPLLYQVYLYQNRGKEFEEMERIVRSLKTTEKDK